MSKTRMNSRQKRAIQARIALTTKALALNPSTVSPTGSLRTSTTGAKARILDETYHGFASGLRQAAIKPRLVTIEGSKLGAHEGIAGKIVDGKVKSQVASKRFALAVTSKGENITKDIPDFTQS